MDRRNDPAEPLPLVPSDPVPLVRAPTSLRESWFDKQAPVSSSELDVLSSRRLDAVPAPQNSSALCGAFVGLVAASAMLTAAMATSHADVSRAIGSAVTKGHTGLESTVGIGLLMVIGMIVGAGFARATIHVQRMLPIAIFGVIFAPVACVAVHALVLKRYAPAAAQALPIGGLVIGAAVAGIVLSFVVPLRGSDRRVAPKRISIA
jgi:hypothetical protein